MKRNIHIFFLFCLWLFPVAFNSCKKQDDWLNSKRLIGDVTPKTLADYQAILDYDVAMNNKFPDIGLIGTDNLFIAANDYSKLTQVERDAYLWKASLWDSQSGISYQWNSMFSVIEYANIILDGIVNIDIKTPGYNNVKGQALFFRAIGYYNLAQIFCKPYLASTAATDLGLPIRLNSDVSKNYPRSTLQQTYDQMLSDLKQAVDLLDVTPLNNRRPARYAALALIAKTYLTIGDYKNANVYADQVLSHTSSLLDFNSGSVSVSKTYRFPPNGQNNSEILFYAQTGDYISLNPRTTNTSFVDAGLNNSYDSNDLRQKLFFAQSGTSYKFRGGYTGAAYVFCGIAINEVYLIRSECSARLGNITSAMDDLNTLLNKRYVTGKYKPKSASDVQSALNIILAERRKELPFTSNIRWEDLRRLNSDPLYQVTISHTAAGVNYTLLPKSTAYTLPIPQSEINISHIEQNPR